VITLDDQGQVMFAFNSADLTPGSEERLKSLLPRLNELGVTRIKVVGHTDNVGSDSYNQALSERRAASVAEYLISQGLAPQKVTSEGRGAHEPIADNATDEGVRTTDGWTCTSTDCAGVCLGMQVVLAARPLARAA
jgi:Outer membrane protein and related peptidoglycan-associated (lipo)proteins